MNAPAKRGASGFPTPPAPTTYMAGLPPWTSEVRSVHLRVARRAPFARREAPSIRPTQSVSGKTGASRSAGSVRSEVRCGVLRYYNIIYIYIDVTTSLMQNLPPVVPDLSVTEDLTLCKTCGWTRAM